MLDCSKRQHFHNITTSKRWSIASWHDPRPGLDQEAVMPWHNKIKVSVQHQRMMLISKVSDGIMKHQQKVTPTIDIYDLKVRILQNELKVQNVQLRI